MDDPTLEQIAWRLAGLSEPEQTEFLFESFARAIETMDNDSLLAFRENCRLLSGGSDEELQMLDILEGQIALRTLGAPRRHPDLLT